MAVERADVVVIGGGPAGSSTATRLARAGLDVVLIDKASFPREKACAEYCSPGVVDALDDLGALDYVTSNGHQNLDGMRVYAKDVDIPLHFGRNRPGGNSALGIKRSVLDDRLLEFAAEHGVRIRLRTRATEPISVNGRIAGVRCKRDGSQHEIHAEFVVAADGLHSTFSRALGLDRPVRWPQRLGLVARYARPRENEPFGEMHVGDGIYCGLSPVEDGVVNVALVVPLGAKKHGEKTSAFFERTIQGLPGIRKAVKDAERVTPVRGIGPLARKVRHTAGNGYLLVGDAAGFFDPLTGEGIHRALRGGELAARAVTSALDRPDRYPVEYEDVRAEHFGDKERVCQIIQLLLQSRHVMTYAARRAASRDTVNRELCGVLGDYTPAARALRPTFLWQLFKP